MKNDKERGPGFYRTSKADAVIIGIILFLSIFSIYGIVKSHRLQASQRRVAVIYQKDSLLEKVDLAKDNKLAIINGRMHIEVNAGKLRVSDSDCPQHICVNMGWIKYSGETLVCVPNRIVVEIKSAGTPLLDAVAY